MSAAEFLDKFYEPKMHWKLVNRRKVITAMKEYAKQQCRYQRQISMLNATELKAKDILGLEYIEKLVDCPSPKFE